MANTTTISRDESSDYDSSRSSTTTGGRSWLSNLSFSSRRASSVSVSSSATDSTTCRSQKPHKANQAAWEAMNRLRTAKGDRVSLDSSCSSTAPDTGGRSWLSDLSFSSRRSSVSSSATDSAASLQSCRSHKPHKANQAAWEAMSRLRTAMGGRVGLDNFRLLRRLGSGDIGNVYLCQIRTPQTPNGSGGGGGGQCLYAMKVVDREAVALRDKLQRAEVEKEILGMLDHPFLPTLYAEFEASHYSCLVMEFCSGGDLYASRLRQPSKRFPISTAKFYAAEVLLALEYLHMMGIIYRDLKPENVLIREDGHIMLSDFDLSLKCDVIPRLLRTKRAMSTNSADVDDDNPLNCYTPTCAAPIRSCFLRRKQSVVTSVTADAEEYVSEMVAEPSGARSKSFVGTHEYLAPEVISGQGHGSAVDWWTLGIFLFEMVYGKTPFKGDTNEKTLINILKKPLSFPRMGVSNTKEYEEMVKVQDLICRLLVKNPKKRIGCLKGSIEIKRHEFFKGVNWALIRSVRPPEVPGDAYKVTTRSTSLPKLSKKNREATYQLSHNFEYF